MGRGGDDTGGRPANGVRSLLGTLLLLPYVLGILGAGRYGGHDSSSIYDIRVHRSLLTGWGQEWHSGSLVGGTWRVLFHTGHIAGATQPWKPMRNTPITCDIRKPST